MDVLFSVCIVRHGSVCTRVWEVSVFRHADGVCVCLVGILWQSNAEFCMICILLMLIKYVRRDHMEEAYPRAGHLTLL